MQWDHDKIICLSGNFVYGKSIENVQLKKILCHIMPEEKRGREGETERGHVDSRSARVRVTARDRATSAMGGGGHSALMTMGRAKLTSRRWITETNDGWRRIEGARLRQRYDASSSSAFSQPSLMFAGDGRRTRQTRSRATATEGRRSVNVVVTGSTKGLGKELARGFLQCGDNVCISSRDEESVRRCEDELGGEYGKDRVLGLACDVSRAKDVQRLTHAAEYHFGSIDVFICNAGTNGYLYSALDDFPPEKLREIVETNALGTLLSCREAIRVMKRHGDVFRGRGRPGHIFLLEGAGSDGKKTAEFAAYGFTKSGMKQLAQSLNAELQQRQSKGVVVHTISPGIVYTEMIDAGKDTFGSLGRFMVNALAQTPEVVAADLVPKIREVANVDSPSAKPIRIEFLTPMVAAKALAERVAFGTGKVSDEARPALFEYTSAFSFALPHRSGLPGTIALN